MKSYSAIIVLGLGFLVQGHYVDSPCPDIFEYRNDGGGIHGEIHLYPRGGSVTTLQLKANFTIATRLLSNYVGRLSPIGSSLNYLQDYNAGAPINYRVDFPVTSPLPRLAALIVNDNVLCYGPAGLNVNRLPGRPSCILSLSPAGSRSLSVTMSFAMAPQMDQYSYWSVLKVLQDYNRGVPIHYRVDFPVSSPLPRLTALYVNDNLICYGYADVPGPNQYVTTTSLQHTLFLQGSGGSGFDNRFESRPQSKPKPDPIFDLIGGDLPNDAQIFTFGDDGERQGSWNSVYPARPNDRPNQEPSRPDSQYYPEVFTQPPRRPEPQYYPEEATQPPSPPRQPPATLPPRPAPPPRQPDPAPVASAPVQPIQCGVVAGGNERQPLIFNGQSYTRGDWPWLVAIYKRRDGGLTFICSGTLVSERHVVTAAHCMQVKNQMTSMRDIVVKVGVYNLEDWGDDITVTRTLTSAIIHESYSATTLANDILVLTFERSVEFNTNIRPACLWSGNSDLSRIVGASGVVAGWGQSETGPAGRGEPRVVRIPVVSTAVCRATRPDFHKLTSANTLCAGDRHGSGPCLGDSGGGLYLLEDGRWRLRGVVSLSLRPESGDSTCNLNEYVVFTDSAQYLPWIRNAMAN